MFNASWPYFTNAILESGNPLDSVSQSLMSPTSALSKATQIGNALGCPTNSNQALFNCLLNANATLFNNAASPAWPYPPVVNDGVYFTQNPITAFNSGKVKKCNILTGSNSKEYAFFEQSLMPEPNPAVFTSTSLNTALQSAFKNVLTSFPNYTSASFISYILQTYNQINQLGKNATQLDYLIQIETDQKYKCPTVALSDIYSNLGSKVFTYFYDYRISTSNFAPKYLAVHKDELAMVFAEPLSVKQKPILNSNPWTSTKYNYSVAERTNSETIINFWSNFVATGDPNNYSAGKTTAWQKWSNNNANGIRNVFYIGGSNSNFNLTNIAYAETSDLICKTFNAGLV
jgi:carboxylesterase type B